MNQVISVWSGDLSSRSKLSQCHSFHGESLHNTPAPGALHLSTMICTMSTWIWMRVKLQWFIFYLILATPYNIASTHDNCQKTEIVLWHTKIYSNLEVYVDTGVSDGILVMLQLQNWIQKQSYLHLNKLSWFCQVMFLVFYFSVWTFHQVLNLVAEWKYLYQGLGMALIGVNQVSTLKIEILY